MVIDVDRAAHRGGAGQPAAERLQVQPADGHVVLRTDTATTTGRVLIEVEDECGGLPPGRAEDLFRPFEQRSADRSGLGLGLAIARESVEVNGGEIRARNLPGRGCIFTIDLPRLARKPAAAIGPTVICGPAKARRCGADGERRLVIRRSRLASGQLPPDPGR